MDKFAGTLPFVQAMDAFFPIGAYTMSNGMETYVQQNKVKDAASLEELLKDYLSILTYTELGFAAHAAAGEEIELLDGLCGASKAAKEAREGSRKLCSRFLKAQAAIREYESLKRYQEKILEGRCQGWYCIAVGLFLKEIEIPIEEGLLLWGYNQLSTMVNHGVKLVPLRQLEGQKVLYEMFPLLEQAVKKAMQSKTADLGACGTGYELACMEHETLECRMYLS